MRHRHATVKQPEPVQKPAKKKEEIQITKEIEPEVIEPPSNKKQYENVGIIGNTIPCREFRAIVKKQGRQINEVITEVLHEWNSKNYNL